MGLRDTLGRVGIWTMDFEQHDLEVVRDAAAELEDLGWPTLWIPEAVGREAFTQSAMLLSATRELTIATGIAQIWGRDPVTMSASHKTMSDWFPDRFVLGIGVSHQQLVDGIRENPYAKPYSRMVEYVDRMAAAPYLAPGSGAPTYLVLAALGPKMLRLAAEKTDGAHPYYVSPEHTSRAREVMGPDAVLAPEQGVVLDADPESARATARAHLGPYLIFENYKNSWKRLGFAETDFEGGGSDRLVDAVVAWGDTDTIRERVEAHLAAGADHVALQVFHTDVDKLPMPAWRELGAALSDF